ncbi:ImmA/IrrE family metallo-endopeptidase [Klebsiella oxytoca]|uniref:ImmA/IrrE family metallo-endopeptidase n=1 Tax=Klebsiella oxytoca TaxID=571 RepID=UPI0025501652|nr:ImmA/IrrE family metallo-endopeptidase [Klebsiella oxytoca]MDK6513436.1 ImmA/IrrE family metallo-endopeptidase [Klebsiella oxytoca]MDK8029530.1 ImmA/IrrE family metallo-endopeptidase [Klebsiella oxytoca]
MFWFSEETASIDAFSFWKDDVPYIFLNTRKSGERSRFDAAHEQAHLVLHRHGDVKGQDAEREADAFASAFLMPLENVMAVKMAFPTFDKIVQLKSLWKVSAMALIVRMRNLNVLTEWQYNSLMRDATAKGYRTGEPGGIERERSLIIEKMMAALAGNGINLTQMSEELNVPLDELSSLLCGVAPISGGSSGTSRSKASLRLV